MDDIVNKLTQHKEIFTQREKRCTDHAIMFFKSMITNKSYESDGDEKTIKLQRYSTFDQLKECKKFDFDFKTISNTLNTNTIHTRLYFNCYDEIECHLKLKKYPFPYSYEHGD